MNENEETATIKILPTVGRVVWFRPSRNAATPGFVGNPDQPCAATVAYVHSPSLVNLSVTDHNGNQHPVCSVPLIQQAEPAPESGFYCEWMPYQIGQAKRES